MQKKVVEVIHHIIDPTGFGGMGVLATHNDGDSFIRISTQPCSPADQYTKKTAAALLRLNYNEGEFIRLPVNKRRDVTHRELRDVVIDLFQER